MNVCIGSSILQKNSAERFFLLNPILAAYFSKIYLIWMVVDDHRDVHNGVCKDCASTEVGKHHSAACSFNSLHNIHTSHMNWRPLPIGV